MGVVRSQVCCPFEQTLRQELGKEGACEFSGVKCVTTGLVGEALNT
jgi:hypothetical protein